MRHPFAGVEPDQKSETTPTRRSLFGLVAGAVAGTIGLVAFGTKDAEAQRQPTTLALGEEGGRPPMRPPGSRPSTRMIGEEGGRPPRQGWKK